MRRHAATLLCSLVLPLGLLCALPGCEDALPDVSWERMIHQDRSNPYQASPFFADGRLMRHPPEGTVAKTHPRGPEPVVEGLSGNAYVPAVPIPVDRALLRRGQNRFDTFCATCHGLRGDGRSVVAQSMMLRKPPSLIAGPVPLLPAGRVFTVISDGYGLMPSYAYVLPVHDRWAVVAYVHALARSQHTLLSELPPELQHQAMEALR